ncbi:MAG: hypothetical protein ACE5LF_01240 [Alphaproteobacteria bacterium]
MIVQELGVVRAQARTRRSKAHAVVRRRPTRVQRRWLERGLSQPGGKLPLFDEYGQAISAQTIKSCIRQGWAEPWIRNPLKRDWLVCKLTAAGRTAVRAA